MTKGAKYVDVMHDFNHDMFAWIFESKGLYQYDILIGGVYLNSGSLVNSVINWLS